MGDRRMIGHLVPLLRGCVELVRREPSDSARLCLKLGAIAFDQRRADVLPQRPRRLRRNVLRGSTARAPRL
jgi:hypothetical protein